MSFMGFSGVSVGFSKGGSVFFSGAGFPMFGGFWKCLSELWGVYGFSGMFGVSSSALFEVFWLLGKGGVSVRVFLEFGRFS